MTKVIKAIIPVRSGSTRVKNKNLRPFAGSNLLTIKIKQLKQVKNLDGIIVNSNDEEMLDVAKNLGVDTVKRDNYFASNNVSINEVYKNLNSNCNSDIVVYANATNPLTETSSIEQAIDYFLNLDNKHDTVNSVHLIKEFLWQDKFPLNFELRNMPRSQDLPNIYTFNFAFAIFNRELAVKQSRIIGDNPYLYELSAIEAIDIDNELDFEFAEFMYKKYRMNNYVKN